MDAMADELSRSQQELMSLRGQLANAQHDKMALLAEVNAAQQASANVAEIVALSDESDPMAADLATARAAAAEAQQVATTSQARIAALEAELGQVRAERERLLAETADRAGALAETRARLDANEALLSELRLAGETRQMELDQTISDAKAIRLERDQLLAERDKLNTDALLEKAELEGARAEIASLQTARAEAEAKARTGGELEGALKTEMERLKGEVAAARTDATNVRLDLQEAHLRLQEATQTQQSLGQERDALRAEAVPLRDWANSLVAEHARQQGELERLRAAAAKADELQSQLAQLQRDRAEGGAAVARSEDAEVLVAGARRVAQLFSGLESQLQGLGRALGFLTAQPLLGGEDHLSALQQLQSSLLRVRDEFAMLDLE